MTKSTVRTVPAYRLHKPTGQAFIEIRGKRRYLGRYDSPASREAYDRIVAELHASKSAAATVIETSAAPAVAPPRDAPPRSAARLPGYRRHSTGQAFVEVGGKRLYLGKHGSDASREKYRRIVAEVSSHPAAAQALREVRARPVRSINEVLLAYWQHVQKSFSRKEQEKKWLALERVMNLFGNTDAAEFGPLSFKTVREAMLAHRKADGQPLTRRYINDEMKRIRAIFKWAVEEELVPATVLLGLQAVAPLKYGRSEARESPRVKPVAAAVVQDVFPFVPPQIRAMIELQLLTGMRSQSLTSIRARDIDMTGPIWIYTPPEHKTSHHGHELHVAIGPQAQRIIREFLTPRLEAYLFRPVDAAAWRANQRRAARKTKLTPSQKKRRKKRKPAKRPGERYTTHSYRQAIYYGFAKLARSLGHDTPTNKATKAWLESVGVATWFPHQTRHTRGTEVRKHFGVEASQVSLGHESSAATEIYAEKNFELAMKVAREIG